MNACSITAQQVSGERQCANQRVSWQEETCPMSSKSQNTIQQHISPSRICKIHHAYRAVYSKLTITYYFHVGARAISLASSSNEPQSVRRCASSIIPVIAHLRTKRSVAMCITTVMLGCLSRVYESDVRHQHPHGSAFTSERDNNATRRSKLKR
jgi:hypothetical protein